MRTIAVYFAPSNRRSVLIAHAMAEGIKKCGDEPLMLKSTSYRGNPPTKIAIFYGLAMGLARVKADYERTGRTAIYCDLGYWTRRIRDRHDGYHKIAVNDRHPTAYLMRRTHDAERFERHGLTIRPWREEGRHILVAGMSAKAAFAEQLHPNRWEEETIGRLRKLTKRPIIYRPKPNWMGAKQIPGTTFDRETRIGDALRDCHAIVTHHSNVAVDALLAGVPVFCEKGAASLLSNHNLSTIERPLMPDGREQWAYNLAYCQ